MVINTGNTQRSNECPCNAKHYGTFLFILLFSLYCSPSASAKEITISVFILEPHVMLDEENGLGGAAIDFFERYIHPELEVSVKWQIAPVPRILKGLQTGRYDAALLIGKTAERKKFAWYPTYSYIHTQACLLVMHDHPLAKVESVDNILPYTIGHHIGALLTPFMQDKRITFDLLGGSNVVKKNLLKLKAKRIDAVYRPVCSSGIYVATQLGMADALRRLDLPDSSEMYTIFSKQSSRGKGLVERYNTILEKLNEDGNDSTKIHDLYQRLLDPYIQ